MEGLRIWIIEKKTNIPKLLREGNVDELCEIIKTLDFKK